ncbi:hypothetical protein [Luteolibacter sp. Populi]|uniref:hypothetical protein n=1 Tax=Luteolibacter sp. Populi TaxID=3230487 RepID=UPI0034678A03
MKHTPPDLFKSLVAQRVFSKSRRSYIMEGQLFLRWLDALDLTIKAFVKPISRATGDLRAWGKAGSPSEGSLKNLRAGRPLSQALIERILPAMLHYDPGLTLLHDLNAQGQRGLLPPGAIEMLRGTWEEFHYTSQGGVSRITKAMLCVVSEKEVFYAIYEPTLTSTGAIHYHGEIELESECVIFRLSCDHPNLTEKLTLRYRFSHLLPKQNQLEGLFTGINFEKLPMASTSVLLLKDKRGILAHTNPLPQKITPKSDDDAIELLQNARDYIEHGPKRLVVHRRWPQDLVAEEIRKLGRNETVDIITTYFSNYYEFVELIDELSKEKPLRKFRCIFADPRSSVFEVRFAFVDGNHTKDLQEQAARLLEYGARGKGKRGVSFEIKYSPFWPMGLALRIGQSALFYGNIFATAGARTGAIIECRDLNSKAAKHFDDDFRKIWNLTSSDSLGDSLVKELVAKRPKKR